MPEKDETLGPIQTATGATFGLDFDDALSNPVPRDPLSLYEDCLKELQTLLQSRQINSSNFLVLKGRMIENILSTRKYGDTPARQAERAQIAESLNALSFEFVGIPFIDLAGSSDAAVALTGQPLAALLAIPQFGPLIDRQRECSLILDLISQNPVTFVYGIAGIGKSSVLAEAARRLSDTYTSVAWLKCREGTDYSTLAVLIGALLAQHGDTEIVRILAAGETLPPPMEVAARLLTHFQRAKTLLVIDEFHYCLDRRRRLADPKLQDFFSTLLDRLAQSRVVFSSRFVVNSLASRVKSSSIEIVGLQEADAKALLRISDAAEMTEEQTQQLYSLTEGHPFALRIFASLSHFYTPADILSQTKLFMDECGSCLLDALLRLLPRQESDWVNRLSVLREAFSLELVKALGGQPAIARALRERFLIDFDPRLGIYEMHPLVRSFAYLKLSTVKKEELHAAAARYYVRKLPETQVSIETLPSATAACYHYSRAGNLKRTLAIGISLTEPLFYMGVLLFKRRSYQEAESCFEAILHIDPQNNRAHFYLAASLDLQGPDTRRRQESKIESHYRFALNGEPRNAQYLDYFAFFLSNMERDEEAARVFQSGVAVGARCPTLYERYAQLLERGGKIGDADRIYTLGCRTAYRSGHLFESYAKFAARHYSRREADSILRWGLRRNPMWKGLLVLERELSENRGDIAVMGHESKQPG